MTAVPVDPGAGGMAFVAVHDLDRALAFYVDTLGSAVLEAPSRRHPEVCVVGSPGDPLAVTLVQVPGEVPTRRDQDAPTSDAALQADLELSRVEDAVVDDAGLWRTPQGDVVSWFRDQAGAIASLAHRAA